MRRRVSAGLFTLFVVVSLLALIPSAGARPAFQARALQPGTTITATKSLSSRLARTDRSLLRLSGSRMVPVIVKLDYDAVASYQGGMGPAATSPQVTGRSLAQNAAAVSAYQSFVAVREQTDVSAIQARIPSAQVTARFRTVYGGVALRVPANQIRSLVSVPGVVAVQRDKLAHTLTDASAHFVGADQVWPQLGGQSLAGDNVVVGVLDSGIWPESPSFKDVGLPPFPGTYGCEFGDGSDPHLGAPFACNNKLIGAYAFTDTYMANQFAMPGEFCDNATGVCSARDADGHGTHTSSTAAGSVVKNVSIFDIPKNPISGMAPGARVIMYRVCLDLGCYNSDSINAIGQAITDGVDVINFSISGGNTPYTDAVELAFLDAYAAGISVNASAGNEGPGAGTVAHGGGWVTTVAASTSDRSFLSTLTLRGVTAGGTPEVFRATGSTITPGVTGLPVVQAANVNHYNDALCGTAFPPGSVTGKVVVCARGTVGRAQEGYNALQGGAAGYILYNPIHKNLFTDNHWLPAIMIEGPQPSGSMLDFMNSHHAVRATWQTGVPTHIQGDEITSFSSRGPSTDFLKPDVTAPGIQILAGTTPRPIDVASGPPGQRFMIIAGTSMSSPHSAGVSALVKAAHPDWTPGQIKSALMTSSVQDVTRSDDNGFITPANPFDTGAGSIRANRAVNPTLTFDVPAEDYYLSTTDARGRVNLNLPSVDAPVMPGQLTTTRSGVNVSGETQTFTATTTVPNGARIRVNSPNWTVAPGGTLQLRITIIGADLPEGQYFGSITLVPSSGNQVFIPVAFVRTQGKVQLSNACASLTIGVGGTSRCAVSVANQDPSPANVSLAVTSSDPTGLRLARASSPAVAGANGFTFDGTLSGAVAPSIDAITAGGSPAGYLPLSSFGFSPIPGTGDETISNFNVPAFLYGDETYTQVGMVSNGYAVVGGGTGSDVNFEPQDIPDPARPNNVIAPFWTDLNTAFGGNMYIGELSDGVNSWIVMDWENVAIYTSGAPVTFQIWLQEGSTESVTWAYGDLPSAGDPSGLVIGAENRDGSSAQQLAGIPANGSDFTVETGSPQPGEVVTIHYVANGKRTGSYRITGRMQSDLVPGISFANVRVKVS